MKKTKRATPRPRNHLRHKFLKAMAQQPSEVFGSHNLKRYARGVDIGTICTTLCNMKTSGQLKRVDLGRYMITKAGFKQAKQLEATA